MKKWFKHSKIEVGIYVVFWFLIFIAPILSGLAHDRIGGKENFSWAMVFPTWYIMVNFLIAFVFHDLFIAPILVFGRKTKMYLLISFIFVLVIQFVSYKNRPALPGPPPDLPSVEEVHRVVPHESPTEGMTNKGAPPRPITRHDLIYFTILLLGMGFNTSVKGYFRSYDERLRLEELERESMKQQLDYLKYQVNPHFLMNTLNNIHALIDINGETAKKSIVKLSKILRHILYDGNRSQITLQLEAEVIKDYVELMRMRYDDSVKIMLDLPESMPNRCIAPLLFVAFIENAFKHGISYNQQSFVAISLKYNDADEKITFKCRNSRIPSNEDSYGGIGLENTRKRLDLIYGKDYAISTDIDEKEYAVTLIIPTTKPID